MKFDVAVFWQMSAVMEGLSTTKTKRFKVKHPKRKLYRASEPLLSVFMWGVNHSVNELTHISIPVMLMPDDFRAFSKIKVDNHAFNKENLPSHFKVRAASSNLNRPFRRKLLEMCSYKDCLLRVLVHVHSSPHHHFRWKSTAHWFSATCANDSISTTCLTWSRWRKRPSRWTLLAGAEPNFTCRTINST